MPPEEPTNAPMDIQNLLRHVSADHLRRDLFHLRRDPLPFREAR